MTTFREYRERAVQGGNQPDYSIPTLPSDAIRYQGERAGFVTRAVAAIIDVLLVFGAVLATAVFLWMMSFVFDKSAPAFGGGRGPQAGVMILYGYVLNVVYWTVGWATGGRTIGNLIMGIRVVNFRGERLRWPGAFVRSLFCTLFIFGLLWVIVSGANRSVQDVVMRTSVIYDWVIGIPGLSKPGPRK